MLGDGLSTVGLLALPVGGSFDDEFVGGGGESVDGGFGEHRVAHDGQPFNWSWHMFVVSDFCC
ncbi:hypothetical protein BTO20_38880 (plasmid) [Mycobacterium dioxanotrophicus]|uniref:Uncharacterized protein n=1 Tax=Mycobacterium dioxanotrophicus TaxID=482462 RepID=A0A1Y0CHD5_9MYCO|nr:hypothetical protein BTO20_38880 [Mycobacterium dioxanotrophicus]